MKLYYHKTDGGAEYYTTRENDISTSVLRTDGDELEIMDIERLQKAGFKSVVFNGKKYDLLSLGEFGVFPIVNGCSTDCVFSGSSEECSSYCKEHKGEGEFIVCHI